MVKPEAFRFFRRVVLSVLLIEIFLGGGGRLIDIGVLSIRMYLFGLSLGLALLFLIAKPALSRPVVNILFVGVVLILMGIVIGYLTNAPISLIFEDAKPLLFIFSLFYFPFLIKDESDVHLISKLLKISAITMAITYLAILLFLKLNIIPFRPFYNWTYRTQEFFFRGESAFFYKGFFYMCIGLFFFKWRKGLRQRVAIIIIVIAILLTFTRDFILSFVMVYVIYFMFIKRKAIPLIIFTFLGAILVPVVWKFVSNADVIDRSISNNNRIVQIMEVLNETTPVSVLVGHGFGRNISSREDLHLEIAFLEIFYKQGVAGLVFWFGLLYLIYFRYKKAVRFDPGLAISFFLSAVFAYVQSLTNPFVNNPLGITLLVIVLLALGILSRNGKLDQRANSIEK